MVAERPFDGVKKTGLDPVIEEQILEHSRRYGIDALDAVKMFPVLVRRQWLKRFLAHVELFKLTLDVPGDIAELGVFRGTGLFTWANFLESYCIGDRTKIVYGFDNWRGFTHLAQEDGEQLPQIHKVEGGFSPHGFLEELKDAIALFDSDRFIPWKARIKLVEGDIEQTVPSFAAANPGGAILADSLRLRYVRAHPSRSAGFLAPAVARRADVVRRIRHTRLARRDQGRG